MKKNEDGMTLVEVLATLVLLSLVTGIIWTTISIATKFSVSETTELQLQQEANYIISQLQQVHRHCYTYELTITESEIKVENCMKDEINPNREYDGIISDRFLYEPRPTSTEEPTKADLYLSDFVVIDPVKKIRRVDVPTTISRYKTKSNDD